MIKDVIELNEYYKNELLAVEKKRKELEMQINFSANERHNLAKGLESM
jgi:hypothetical protein